MSLYIIYVNLYYMYILYKHIILHIIYIYIHMYNIIHIIYIQYLM